MIHIEEKDTRTRAFLYPKRIVWTQGQVENSQVLLTKREHQITSIRILRSSSSSSSIMNEDDYILTNDEMIEFFDCFKETSLKEVEDEPGTRSKMEYKAAMDETEK